MGIKYLSEKEIAEQFDSSDYLLAVKTITEENEGVETTRRVIRKITTQQIVNFLASALDSTFATDTAVTNALLTMYPNLVKSVEQNQAGDALLITYWDDQTVSIPYSSSGGGLAFDGGYVDEENKLHLSLNGEDIDGFDPIPLPSGGGGGSTGSMMVFAVLSGTSAAVTNSQQYVPLTIKFTSVVTGTEIDTGNGTLQVYINDVLYKTISVAQGNSITLNELVAVADLNNNANTVELVMTDSYGLSARRKVTVTKMFLSLAWDIASETIRNSQSSFTVNVMPTGAAGIRKDIVVRAVGPNGYDVSVTKNTTISGNQSVPVEFTNLTAGAYVLTASCSMTYNGVLVQSNNLCAAIAQVSANNEIAVASSFMETTGTQYTTLAIPYRAVKGSDTSTTITLRVVDGNNQELFSSTDSVDTTQHIWNYKPTVTGNITLSITCGTASWQHTMSITALDIPVNEVLTGLDYKLDASNLSSLTGFVLSNNFDVVNGGIVTDSDGNKCLRVMKGDRLTIPYNLFGLSTDTVGKSFKIIYTIENVTNISATAIQCLSGGIGLDIKANKIIVNSSLTTGDLVTCEGEKTELDVNVTSKSNHRLLTLWEHGMPHKVVQYSADSDKFNQDTPVGITVGSDDCTVSVYLIRSYSKQLSNSEILTNFIVDAPDGEQIVDRYNRNAIFSNGVDESGNPIADISGNLYKEFVAAKNTRAHIFTISAPGFPVGKKSSNYISGTVDYELRSGGAARKFKNAVSMRYRLQGTSSLDYIDSAGNVDIDILDDIVWDDDSTHDFKITDNSIPISYLNIKVNDASSEHINNILLAEWFNRFQPYKRPAREADSRVRDTVEGDMCIFFYRNSGEREVKAGPVYVQPGETVLYALGNINNSKKNETVFAHNDTDDVLCVEVNNNIDNACRFKRGNVVGTDFGDEEPFGIRFISDTIIPSGTSEENAAAALWTIPVDFVVSCNPDGATNADLAEPVTYTIDKAGNTRTFAIDSAEYRVAKFRNEAADYFEVDSLIYHYLFTLFFCMVDNRAKNTFYGYSAVRQKWHLCFGYDFDTAMGINNVGRLNLDYGYLDTDHIDHNNNAGMVYNAADSTMFALIRSAFPEECKDMQQSLETQGCFNMQAFSEMCDSYQNKFCEALWIEDFQTKYVKPLINLNDASFLEKGLGPKRLQRKQFLKFQQPFISSYFISDFSRDNQATFRCYGNSASMTVTPYSDQYVTFIGGNTVKQVRAFAGIPVTIDISDFSANDTETHIRNAPFIQDLGDLSELKMSSCQFSNFRKVKSIIIGSSENEYENAQLTSLDVSNCIALETLNIGNCTNFGGSTLNLVNNVLLKTLVTTGSAITGVMFANGGRIETAMLNAVRSLTMKNLTRLTTLQFDTSSLVSAVIENCSYSNITSLLSTAVNIQNLRAINVSLQLQNSSLLKRLANRKGWDADNNETPVAVVTGTCHISGISETVLAKLRQTFTNELTITYDFFIPEYTVRFMIDSTVYDTQVVEQGGSAEEPSGTPTKASTASTVFTFVGWGASYANIQQDTDIPAVFGESTRQYTVTYLNGLLPIQVDTVDYGGTTEYTGSDVEQQGYLFDGWENTATHEILPTGAVTVMSDITLVAHFIEPVLPSAKVDDYDYLVSCDPDDYVSDENGRRSAAYTWGEFYAICEAGLALGEGGYFTLKDKIKIIPVRDTIVRDETIEFMLVDTNHCRLASDETALAKTVWQTVGTLNQQYSMNGTNTNVGGYNAMPRSTWLNSTFFNQLPPIVRSAIKEVKILSNIGNQKTTAEWGSYKVWLASMAEVGLSTNAPYNSEIDPLSVNRTFPVYPSNSSRIKRPYNNQGDAVYWWLRSPTASSSSQFSVVSTNGTSSYYYAGSNYSLAPCFCI